MDGNGGDHLETEGGSGDVLVRDIIIEDSGDVDGERKRACICGQHCSVAHGVVDQLRELRAAYEMALDINVCCRPIGGRRTVVTIGRDVSLAILAGLTKSLHYKVVKSGEGVMELLVRDRAELQVDATYF